MWDVVWYDRGWFAEPGVRKADLARDGVVPLRVPDK